MVGPKFYAPDKKSELSKEEFISIYSSDYFLKQNSEKEKAVKGIRRSSKWVEKEIEHLLEDGIKNEKDIIHILAWKVGKIKHAESDQAESFVYSSDWNNCEKFSAKLYGKELVESDFKKFIEYIQSHIIDLEDKANKRDIQSVMNTLKEKSCAGIGTVYMITLLYFISRGTWPIYDKYAQVAVTAILKGSKPEDPIEYSEMPNKNDTKFDIIMDENGAYKKYVKDLKDIFGNEYNNRDVDRALWVYGHLFNTKGAC